MCWIPVVFLLLEPSLFSMHYEEKKSSNRMPQQRWLEIISWVNVRSIVLYSADISSHVMPPAQLESKLESHNKHKQEALPLTIGLFEFFFRCSQHLKKTLFSLPLWFPWHFLTTAFTVLFFLFSSLVSHWIALLYHFYSHTKTLISQKMVVPLIIFYITSQQPQLKL